MNLVVVLAAQESSKKNYIFLKNVNTKDKITIRRDTLDKNDIELEQAMLYLMNLHLSQKGIVNEETKNAIEDEIAKLSI